MSKSSLYIAPKDNNYMVFNSVNHVGFVDLKATHAIQIRCERPVDSEEDIYNNLYEKACSIFSEKIKHVSFERGFTSESRESRIYHYTFHFIAQISISEVINC